MKILPKVIIAKNDPEKAITPVIVFRYKELEESPEVRGFAVLLGWWHFWIGFHFLWISREHEK